MCPLDILNWDIFYTRTGILPADVSIERSIKAVLANSRIVVDTDDRYRYRPQLVHRERIDHPKACGVAIQQVPAA
jgi:hypothetical protein